MGDRWYVLHDRLEIWGIMILGRWEWGTRVRGSEDRQRRITEQEGQGEELEATREDERVNVTTRLA